MTIYQEILNFNIVNGYYPSASATVAKPGFGKLKNQFPMDKNLTFFPSDLQGTFEVLF